MKLIDILVEELPKHGGWPNHVNCIIQDNDLRVELATCHPSVAKFSGAYWFLNSSRTDGFEVETLASDYTTAIITREQYESALAAKNDGWIEWGGGECPVPRGTLVDVKYLCGDVNRHIKAGEPDSSGSIDTAFSVRWSKLGAEYDIIAYRLHQPQEVAQIEAEQEAYLNECIGQAPETEWNGDGLPPVGVEIEYKFAKVNYHTDFSRGKVLAYGAHNVFMEHWASKNEFIQPLDKIEFRPIRSQAQRKRDEAAQALCDAGGGNGKVDEKAGYGSCWFDIYDSIAAGKIPGIKLED